jgi:redox-sensitive bicupin YhaK (pirin superfamily)
LLILKNGFHNRDSLGEEHVILPGGLYWSRAAKGMIHEETPLPGGGTVRGLQIFLNLPEAQQGDDAGAYPVLPEAVQSAAGEGWNSRTAVNGTAVGSASQALPAPVQIAEVAIEKGAIYPLDLPAGWGGTVIALEGEVALGDERTIDPAQGIGFAAEAAASLHITATAGAARIAIVMGQQLKQPIHAYGPLMLASPKALERARAYVGTLSIPQLHPAD